MDNHTHQKMRNERLYAQAVWIDVTTLCERDLGTLLALILEFFKFFKLFFYGTYVPMSTPLIGMSTTSVRSPRRARVYPALSTKSPVTREGPCL